MHRARLADFADIGRWSDQRDRRMVEAWEFGKRAGIYHDCAQSAERGARPATLHQAGSRELSQRL